MAKLTARERLKRKKEIKTVTLDYNYGGMKAGERMFVATPQIVDSYIRTIPYGESRSIPAMRLDLAQQHDCDGSCPMSTSIFVRMSAEAALEDLAENSETDTAPFWRIIKSKDKIAKRLNIDPNWIDLRRAAEGLTD